MKTVFFFLTIMIQINTFAKENKSSEFLISEKQFTTLAQDKQNEYIVEAQKAVYEFEVKLAKSGAWHLAEMPSNKLLDLILPQANAYTNGKCLIGGVLRSTLMKDGREICPTKGRSEGCNMSDGFECGHIFHSVCIDREPIDTISFRCYNKAHTLAKPIKRKFAYPKLKSQIESIITNYCGEKEFPKDYEAGCTFVIARFLEINNKVNPKSTEDTQPISNPETSTK